MQMQEQPTQQADAIDLMINMGPQHPSTHGVFRLVIWVDGERIVRAEPHIGYLHRGSEKLSEGELYSQVITLFDRPGLRGEPERRAGLLPRCGKADGFGGAGASQPDSG